VIVKGRPPCYGVTLAGARRSPHHGPVQSHTLHVDRAATAGLRELFVGVAEATGCFFASAEVLRGHTWTGRALYGGAAAEHGHYLAGRGDWVGLPPRPVAWTWYGPRYAKLVERHLPGAEPTRTGLLHRWADPPPDRDQIASPTPWLPHDLLVTVTAGPLTRLDPATRMARGLRRLLWSNLVGPR
jgi:hypothetical protein